MSGGPGTPPGRATGGKHNVVDGWTAPGFTHRQELGRGACGRVVLAVDDESQTAVAIKYLNEDLRQDGRFLERYRADARRLSQLEDPNVVDLYDFLELPEGSAVVMELVQGVSLARMLAAQGATGPLAALSVLGGTLLGLAAVHSAGVLHRNLRPAEILIDEAGNVRLTDFGLSPGEPPGTADYLAPELWSGSPPSEAGDLYAATVVFFECLTGHRPFTGRNNSALAKAHREGPIPVEEVPGPLRELISRGLAKDPADRPASAADFAEALEEAARSAYGPAWEAQGRSRLTEMAAATAALPPPDPAQQRAADRSRGSGSHRTVGGEKGGRRRWPWAVGAAVLAVAAAAGGAYALTGSSGGSDGPPPSPPASSQPAAAQPTTPAPGAVAGADLARQVTTAVTARRSASFVHRGPGVSARGALQLDAYDMTVSGAQAALRRPARAIVLGTVVYVRVGSAWRPVPVAQATGAYAGLAARAREGGSVRGVIALLQSSTSIQQTGGAAGQPGNPVYRGTTPLAGLGGTPVAGPLFTRLAGSGQASFVIELDRTGLPLKVQYSVTGPDGRAQTYRTHYANWGRRVAIARPR
ncbi:serine/threonine-protein kinase [Actinomadura craniellae]|nr:serine/threonine-protein kinase [Actinomadura craniellae]